tara:strand:+ start:12115 stop:14211 length:2097 start_codon:yes stop_codon:yes gene_type:complete
MIWEQKIMNAKSLFSATILAYIIIATLSGCSKTTKKAEELPELISAINFPYIKNNTLYSFNPKNGDSELLAVADTGLILALDTDESNKEVDDNNIQSFEHSISPEYFTYANHQTLHIYDVKTRKDHQVYDFKNDIIFDPETKKIKAIINRYICDIQKIITWDDESRLAKNVLYKDELGVYVKTSSINDCSDSSGSFNYWQINFEESKDDTKDFSIRRNYLLTHSHSSTHFHDHDNEDYELANMHEHEHTLLADEEDENGQKFNPNNHEHSHEHQHDFLYGNSHPHDNLTKDEVDSVHNDLKNQEIKFEIFPVFIGKKSSFTSIDEALMYSGRPVIDIPNRKFGYLGFNTKEKAYKFYSVKTDKLDKSLLWILADDSFNLLENNYSSLNLSDLEKLSPKHNRFSTFQYINSDISIIINNKIIFFTLEELFDDDEIEARELRIANPIFTSNISNPSLSDRIKYSPSNKKMVITENKDILTIDFSTAQIEPAKLIKRFNEPYLENLESTYISDDILIEKNFLNQDIQQNSIVILQESGLEDRTTLTKTLNSVSTIKAENEVFINVIEADTQTKSAEYFTTNLSSTLQFDDSIWSLETLDYRNNIQTNTASIFSSESSPNEQNSVTKPNLFLFNKNELYGQGEGFGYVPQDITGARRVVIFTDLFGLVEVTNLDSSISTYFFSNNKSSFNFDNEYKNMKPLE